MDNKKILIACNDEHGLKPIPTAGKKSVYFKEIGRSFYENEFNKEAKKYFILACKRQGFSILDVKESDYDISLTTRVQIVNKAKPNLLITFAYNAYGDGESFNSVNGFEVFYSSLNVEANKSRILANYISNSLENGTKQRNRGVKKANYYILRSSSCPSVLIEAGFMTNLIEAKRMLDPSYQKEVGEETCMGVCKYLGVKYVKDKELTYPVLRKGSKGEMVKYLQSKLLSRLYNVGVIDGIFGNNTLNAIKNFQKDNNLVVDGIVGKNTWNKLKGII